MTTPEACAVRAITNPFLLQTTTAADSIPAPGPWYAVRVRSHFEHVTAAALNGRGLETFLAVYRASRTTSPGKSSKRPMFPGYVFCRLNVSDRLPVLSCTGVVNIVSFGGQLAVVDETEIAAIEAVQCAGLGAQPWPYLSGGRRVRIEAGPLKGVEGIVNAAKNQFRLVLSVSLLQRSVLVEVERDWIVPLDGSARM